MVKRKVVHHPIGYRIAWRAAIRGVLAAMLFSTLAIQPRQASAMLLDGVDGATDVFAIAARADRGACRHDDLDRLEAIVRDAPSDPSQQGDLWMVRTLTYACLGRRRAAAGAAERAGSLNPTWRGVAWRYLGEVPVDWLDAPLWQFGPGGLEAWGDALGALDDTARAARIARWDAYAPTTRLAAPLEALAWRAEPDRRRAITRRLQWIRSGTAVVARVEKALELLATSDGATAMLERIEAADLLFDAAAAAARAQEVRRAAQLSDRLGQVAYLSRVEASELREVWEATAQLDGRRTERGRRTLAEHASRPGRVGAEARWALLVDARQRDADAEAFALTEHLLAAPEGFRRIDALEACVHLAGAHGRAGRQAECWWQLQRDARYVSEHALTALAIEVAVDALARGEAADAMTVLVAAPADTLERAYWLARAHLEAGAVDEASAAFEQVRQRAPLSYYALQADRYDAQSPPKFAPTLRTLAMRPSSGTPALVDAPAARLLALGMPRTARRWGAWSAQLAGPAVPEAAATAALAHRAVGESGAALWLLQRHASISAWPRETLERVGPEVIGLAWPRPFEKAFAQAPAEGAVSASWLRAFARRESSFRADAVSSVGARGLLQVLTSTAREVTRRAGWQDLPSRSELLDPRTSVAVAALALREWHADPGPCFAPVAVAYAAGPGKVRRWVRGSAPVAADVWLARMPYPTVRNYAREVETASVAYATLEHHPVPSEGRCVVGG